MVLIGEMRDLETIEAALTVAETGHLVLRDAAHQLARCRRSTASSTCSRRTSSRRCARSSRSCSKACCRQALIPRANGPGRALALEVMMPNPAIRNLIREDKVHQIYSQMQIGQDKFGMQTMNQSLASLLRAAADLARRRVGPQQRPRGAAGT